MIYYTSDINWLLQPFIQHFIVTRENTLNRAEA